MEKYCIFAIGTMSEREKFIFRSSENDTMTRKTKVVKVFPSVFRFSAENSRPNNSLLCGFCDGTTGWFAIFRSCVLSSSYYSCSSYQCVDLLCRPRRQVFHRKSSHTSPWFIVNAHTTLGRFHFSTRHYLVRSRAYLIRAENYNKLLAITSAGSVVLYVFLSLSQHVKSWRRHQFSTCICPPFQHIWHDLMAAKQKYCECYYFSSRISRGANEINLHNRATWTMENNWENISQTHLCGWGSDLNETDKQNHSTANWLSKKLFFLIASVHGSREINSAAHFITLHKPREWSNESLIHPDNHSCCSLRRLITDLRV